MKHFQHKVFLIIIFLVWQLSAQERFKDIVFNKITSETYTYKDTLKLDFYWSNKDQSHNKPLLILVHGGGFSSGKRYNPLEKKFCTDMAKRGYAVASISYHLTRKGKSFGCDYPSEGKIKTFNSVSRDIIDATSFLVGKANLLMIDPTKIVLIGSSAGAEAVLNTVYQSHKNSHIKYSGVVSFAGALTNLDGITPETAVPSVFFHGEKDNLVPYGVAPHHFCKEGASGYLMLFGPQAIAEKLRTLNKSYLVVHDPKGNHDWANKSYKYTNEIADFIAEAIIKQNKIQSNFQISTTR
ncbi:alpha/beta hydrolase [Galbibacter sp. BG1]|uniref:alpha/beta hydrolase n=1 Tax=Galbibacter sp. BG1 TaxID=1170699 RepID=UPI0015BBCF1F|nr:alpha/beta hydrolase [Galbibacter sp. BG1]QLE02253.1 alpha/beta hydrolase [Galbibacter sp. BG1]